MGYRFKLIGADAGALENPAVVGRGGFELRGNAGGFPGQNEKEELNLLVWKQNEYHKGAGAKV